MQRLLMYMEKSMKRWFRNGVQDTIFKSQQLAQFAKPKKTLDMKMINNNCQQTFSFIIEGNIYIYYFCWKTKTTTTNHKKTKTLFGKYFSDTGQRQSWQKSSAPCLKSNGHQWLINNLIVEGNAQLIKFRLWQISDRALQKIKACAFRKA